MVYISPLNNSIIKKQTDRQERVYQHLANHANDEKPDEAKALLVVENPVQSALSSVKDVFQDGKNFFKAVKTGQMNDNSLGRINDLGMKAGALMLATYLANISKTKTNAIMQYIGAATFFSVMSLWPKLFINLPARLIHGFRIDQKYISAQGEKKDFFLDNQFLPWDTFSKFELRKNAVNAGIDYDSENGEEKIKRKMQKTALQNRTLWMATAGFATPLLTALIGDKITPVVKEKVIESSFNKSQKALYNIDNTLSYARPIYRNQKELDTLFEEFSKTPLDDKGLEKIAGYLNIDIKDAFKDPDDYIPISNIKHGISVEQLKAVQKQKSTILDENLADILKSSLIPSDAKSVFTGIEGVSVENGIKGISAEVIDEVVEKFNNSDSKTFKTLSGLIESAVDKNGLDKSTLEQLNSIDFKYDNTPFFDVLKRYNNEVLAPINGRLKTYLDILNPIAGRKDESVYTNTFRQWIKKILNTAKFKKSELKDIETAPVNNYASSIEPLSKFFRKISDSSGITHAKKLEKYMLKDNMITAAEAQVWKLSSDENLAKITGVNASKDKEIFEFLNGNLGEKISHTLKEFLNTETINVNSIKARVLMASNFENFAANGKFLEELQKAKLIKKDIPFDFWLEKARYIIYESSLASDACNLEINKDQFKKLKEIMFNRDNYNKEVLMYPHLEEFLNSIRNCEAKINPKDNACGTGLAPLLRESLKDMFNNASWKKMFAPMAIILIAVTLFVQPFFGNIDYEFPKSKQKEDK